MMNKIIILFMLISLGVLVFAVANKFNDLEIQLDAIDAKLYIIYFDHPIENRLDELYPDHQCNEYVLWGGDTLKVIYTTHGAIQLRSTHSIYDDIDLNH